MKTVTIEYKKRITSCEECPFLSEIESGSECSRTGTYFVASCTKLGETLKKYDRDEYFEENFKIDIPNNCPFSPYNIEIPNYGDIFTVNEFKEFEKYGDIMDDDGSGYYAMGNKMSNIDVFSNEQPHDATHVVWFNK